MEDLEQRVEAPLCVGSGEIEHGDGIALVEAGLGRLERIANPRVGVRPRDPAHLTRTHLPRRERGPQIGKPPQRPLHPGPPPRFRTRHPTTVTHHHLGVGMPITQMVAPLVNRILQLDPNRVEPATETLDLTDQRVRFLAADREPRLAERVEPLDRDPSAHVRRPKQDYESSTLGLDRNELGAFLVQAGLCGGRDHALACLLALNGLRISEALNADIDNLDVNRGHRTLFIHRKGHKTATIPLSPRTARALDLYIAERESGPIFLNHDGTRRLDRHASARIVRRLAKRAGIEKRISPHSLRHSFITAALDAGVPLRDVQEAASHADPRTTMRYDRGRGSLDRHATYIVSTFVAGASR